VPFTKKVVVSGVTRMPMELVALPLAVVTLRTASVAFQSTTVGVCSPSRRLIR
jgi:hypothetical protein